MKLGNERAVEASGGTPFAPVADKPSPWEPWHLSQVWLLKTFSPFLGFPEEGTLESLPAPIVCALLD
jgi:hypothetical protein